MILAVLPFVGELLRWEVRYLNLVCGQAQAEVSQGPDQSLRIEGTAKNADWYSAIYTLNDRVLSHWRPGQGSQRYETWFTEGGFVEEQRWSFDPTGIDTWRRQWKQGAWQTSEGRRTGGPGLEDPVSAFFRLRIEPGPGPWSFPVFSGKSSWTLTVTPVGTVYPAQGPDGAVPAQDYTLTTAHRGDLEQKGRLVLTLSNDEARLPLALVAHTNVGAIRARLVSRRPPR